MAGSGGPESTERREHPAEGLVAPGAAAEEDNGAGTGAEGGDSDSPAGAPALTPLAAGYLPDEEALRGTRFEFGGRRPYSFQPRRSTPDAVPPPGHPASAQRPLPGIGTVALGKVVRTALYGAFVDFLGFRGLIHISQLLPGYRVERVEDVVQGGDEVVVRVIAIDPERRHINLALVPTAPGVTHLAAAGAPVPNPSVRPDTSPPVPPVLQPVAASSFSEPPPLPPQRPPAVPAQPVYQSQPASQSLQEHPPQQTDPAPPAPARPEAPSPTPESVAPTTVAEPAQAPPPLSTLSTPSPAQPVPSGARPARSDDFDVRVVPDRVPPARQPAPTRAAQSLQPASPPRPAQATPAARPRAPAGPPPPPASPSAPPAAPPNRLPAPPVARHGARAVRRETVDPSHPMARLLAATGAEVLRPAGEKDRLGPAVAAPGGAAAGETPGEPAQPVPAAVLFERTVHEAAPEPEPEEQQPATLEALAARFSHRKDKLDKATDRPGKPDRSRQEREKQAAILARLRGEGGQ